MNRELAINNFSENIYSIVNDLGLSVGEFYDIAGGKKYKSLYPKKLDIVQLSKLSESFNVSPMQLINGEYCKDALKAQYLNNRVYLSKSQLANRGTRIRTLKNCLVALGPFFHPSIIQELQLTQEHFENEDMLVGAHLLVKLIKKGIAYTNEQALAERVGQLNGITFVNSKAPNSFVGKSSLRECYTELMEHHMPMIEKNRVYNIEKVRRNTFLFSSKPSQEFIDFFCGDLRYAEYGNQLTQGFAIGMSKALGHGTPNIKLLSGGDVSSEPSVFEVVFS